MSIVHVHTDQLKSLISSIRAGDEVYLTGNIYTARDAAHKRIKNLIEKHPNLVKCAAGAVTTVGTVVVVALTVKRINRSGGGSSSSSSDDYYSGSSDDDYNDSSSSDECDIQSSSRDYPDERSSPEEHTVSAHGQHYHTRDGVIWKEKDPYQRGGKHDDD